MNYFKSTELKSALLIILMAIYWLWAGLGFADKVNGFRYYQDMMSNLYESQNLAANIQMQNLKLIESSSPGLKEDQEFNSSKLDLLVINLLANLQIATGDPFVENNVVLKRKINLINENSTELNRVHKEYIVLINEKSKIIAKFVNQVVSIDETELDRTLQKYFLTYNPFIIEDILDGDIQELIVNDEPGVENNLSNAEDPNKTLKDLLSLDYKIGFYNKTALTGDLMLFSTTISQQLESFIDDYKNLHQDYNKSFLTRFFVFLFISGVLILLILFLFNQQVMSNLNQIRFTLQNLSDGKLNEDLNIPSDIEFSRMMFLINKITNGLIEKKSFAKSISEGGNVSGQDQFSEEDELGNALDKMAKKLELARKEDAIHKEDNRIRNWHSEGLAKFGEIFRSERDDVKELAFKVIKMLVDYLNSNQGMLFIINDEDEANPFMEAIAAFAFDRRKYPDTKINFGEGLVGTCALEKETIYINEVPDDYIQISSGLGEAPPRAILILPLKIENEIFGIIEIASFTEFDDYVILFTEQLAESIATTLSAVKINEKTSQLLVQSQLQAKNMAEQEEEMKRNVLAFNKSQEESLKKEKEISEILNAMNASALVAEFSLNGRYSEINKRFLETLEISKEQAIGKHHSDFAEVEKYSEAYKKFWRDLREGEIVYRTEKYKLFSGGEIWLKQTFSPIQNNEGKTIKILNVSHDITQTITQKDALENQSNEIARRNIELKSLSQAVDDSIIKCEYNPDGIIIDANKNFCDILGYSMKEMIGKNNRIFLKDDEKEQFNTILSQVLKEKPYSGIVKRSKPTGEETYLMANFTPVKDEGGNIYKIYFLSQDVTEKKLKYQLLEEANKEIDRLRDLLENIQKK